MQLSCDLVVVLLGVYPREMKTVSYKNLYMNFHSSSICNISKLETTPLSLGK